MSATKLSRKPHSRGAQPPVCPTQPQEPIGPFDGRARLLRRIRDQIQANRCVEALPLLEQYGRAPESANLRAVCLMRMGQADAALSILRDVVLQPGCTWMRTHVPKWQQLNFATALLLTGRPNGCADVLDEIDDESNPGVQRLRGAIQSWSHTLSWWSRLWWFLGRIAPNDCRVPIDFAPGELEEVPSQHPSASAGA